jgi:hypothetical protein
MTRAGMNAKIFLSPNVTVKIHYLGGRVGIIQDHTFRSSLVQEGEKVSGTVFQN